jgi:hypothetical protein
MRVDLLSPEASEWHAFVQREEHDFYHLPSYVGFCARAEGGEPCALYVEDGARRLLLPLILRPLTGGLQDASSPYGYPGPLVTGTTEPAFLADALAVAQDALAQHRIVSLFVRSHPLLGPHLSTHRGTIVDHGFTLSIDLTLSPDELWRRTSSAHRNEITQASRAGHLVYFDERFTHLDAFVRIYRDTMARVNARGYYLFPDDYFTGLIDALGPRLHLCVVEIRGEIAGAGLFVETRGLLQYHLSGSDHRFQRERPTKLMLHFVRTWAKERGVRRFHLGGGVGGEEDSLYRFKAGFSTDRHPFRTLRLVCDEGAYNQLVRATHPEANPRDPLGFFPLYRRPA